MGIVAVFPLILAALLAYVYRENNRGEIIFSSIFAGAFFGLFSYFFSMVFLSGLLYILGGALVDSLIKVAGVNLRRGYSLFFGVGFGGGVAALSLFYGSLEGFYVIYGLLISTASVLFHSSTSVMASGGSPLRGLTRVTALSILYNILLFINTWETAALAIVYSSYLLFRVGKRRPVKV